MAPWAQPGQASEEIAAWGHPSCTRRGAFEEVDDVQRYCGELGDAKEEPGSRVAEGAQGDAHARARHQVVREGHGRHEQRVPRAQRRHDDVDLQRLRRKKVAQASASWLTGGSSQRQIVPRAAASFGQPRPISRLVRINAGRPHRPCFPQRCGTICSRQILCAEGSKVYMRSWSVAGCSVIQSSRPTRL